jgi:hypothetical protein
LADGILSPSRIPAGLGLNPSEPSEG